MYVSLSIFGWTGVILMWGAYGDFAAEIGWILLPIAFAVFHIMFISYWFLSFSKKAPLDMWLRFRNRPKEKEKAE